MNHSKFEKITNNISNRIKGEKIDVQKLVIHGGFIAILVIATTSLAIADESVLTQSFSSSEFGEKGIAPQGQIEDFSWIKRVSTDGVIEISGIEFSVVNNDKVAHSFEICTIIQGPSEIFTPSLDSSLACITTNEIQSNQKLVEQIINLPKGVKVSELVDISIAIQEL